jgi:hypothetical protein
MKEIAGLCLLSIGLVDPRTAFAGPLPPNINPLTQETLCGIADAQSAQTAASNCDPLTGGTMSGPNLDSWGNGQGGVLYLHTTNYEAEMPPGGSLTMTGTLTAGTCQTGTLALGGVTTSMALAVSAQAYPGDGFDQPVATGGGGNVILHVCNRASTTQTLNATYNVTPLPAVSP